VAGNTFTPEDLVNEARAIFPNTLVAKDFLSLEVCAGGDSKGP
jgi:ribonuclease Z